MSIVSEDYTADEREERKQIQSIIREAKPRFPKSKALQGDGYSSGPNLPSEYDWRRCKPGTWEHFSGEFNALLNGCDIREPGRPETYVRGLEKRSQPFGGRPQDGDNDQRTLSKRPRKEDGADSGECEQHYERFSGCTILTCQEEEERPRTQPTSEEDQDIRCEEYGGPVLEGVL